MSLPNVVAAIVLITGLTLACGASEETPARDDPAPAAQPTAPAAQSQAAAETTAPAATEAAEEENKGPQPPPKDELIKFANWDDNPVKLLNWIAGVHHRARASTARFASSTWRRGRTRSLCLRTT